MDRGWLKLYRKIDESMAFADPYLLKVWIWCLVNANYKKDFVPMRTGKGVTTVAVEPGQFIFGRRTAAKSLRMSPSMVTRKLEILSREPDRQIEIKADHHWSVITVLNWSTYQSADVQSEPPIEPPIGPPIEPPTDQQRTTTGPATDTAKNTKKVRNTIDIESAKIFDRWNSFAEAYGIPAVKERTKRRIEMIAARAKQGMIPKLDELFVALSKSPFCLGKADAKWRATFDWIFDSPNNWVKVIEGNYIEDSKASKAPPKRERNIHEIERENKERMDRENKEWEDK